VMLVNFFVWCAFSVCRSIDDYITDKIEITNDKFFNEQ
jgi:hypothetical protein